MAHTARTQSRLRLPPNARSARVPDAKHTQCHVRREAHTCTQSMSSGCEAHSVPCPSQAHTCPCGMCPGCKALAEPCPSRSTCMLWRRCGRNKLTRKQPDEHVACTRATRTSQMLAQPREARHERLAATCTCCKHTKQRGCPGCIAQPAEASDCSVQLHMRVGGRHKVTSHACFACVRKVRAAESTRSTCSWHADADYSEPAARHLPIRVRVQLAELCEDAYHTHVTKAEVRGWMVGAQEQSDVC